VRFLIIETFPTSFFALLAAVAIACVDYSSYVFSNECTYKVNIETLNFCDVDVHYAD